MSTVVDAFVEHGRRYRNAVVQATWGHLVPLPGDYPIIITFAHTDYRETVLVKTERSLPDSPWMAQAEQQFAQAQAERLPHGRVAVWRGTLRWFKNGSHRFVNGKVSMVRVPEPTEEHHSPRHRFVLYGKHNADYGQILDTVFEMADDVGTGNGWAPERAIAQVLADEGWRVLPAHQKMIADRLR